jgi:hypothetical protein
LRRALDALDFFNTDFWKGSRPNAETILEVFPVGDSRMFRVRVRRVLACRRIRDLAELLA